MKKRWIRALALAMATTATLNPMNALAYGETNDKSTLISDTQNISDYNIWKNTVWNITDEEGNLKREGQAYDSGKVILTPGKTEKDLGFAWYSESKGKPAVKIGKKEDLSDAKTVEGKATDINRANRKKTYKASNMVSVTNYFEENTTYYYAYTDDLSGGKWSQTFSYTSRDASKFQTILVGDPQVGASGRTGQGTDDDINIAVDTYNWNKTVEQMKITAPNASFILSAGDQVDYSGNDETDTGNVRESEYAGFIYPDLLRNVPLATTIGNHESKGTDYQYHYNNPNSGDKLGMTNSGADYYFSYGEVLFISLNSNNRNTLEHRELLKKAVESHPDAKWRVVMFHHDIYGSGISHSDTDGANLRILFAPLMDEFNIDICLTGHDHCYTRSYLLSDGTAIHYDDSVAMNPEGTLYITAGSASGSKFYNLATTKQYYIAERTNTQLPTFSTIDFSKHSLTIKTYDYNGNKYADDYTLYKTKDKVSMKELIEESKAIKNDNYTEESWNKLQEEIAKAEKLMNYTAEDKGARKLAEVYDKTVDGDNEKDMLSYYAYAQKGYGRENSSALAEGFSTLLDKTLSTMPSMTQEEVDEAFMNLAQAQVGLTKKEPVLPKEEPKAQEEQKEDKAQTVEDKPEDNKTQAKESHSEDSQKEKMIVKAGKKRVKNGSTLKLKKGKKIKLKLSINGLSGESVKYKTSNKKVVKVTSRGMIKALKKSRKKVKITVAFGSEKITFKVKVK